MNRYGRFVPAMLAVAALTALPGGGMAQETRQLDGMSVIGAQELPKALYIIPWKQAEPGDPGPATAQGLLGEALAPLDRDIFRRELDYHQVLHRQRHRFD